MASRSFDARSATRFSVTTGPLRPTGPLSMAKGRLFVTSATKHSNERTTWPTTRDLFTSSGPSTVCCVTSSLTEKLSLWPTSKLSILMNMCLPKSSFQVCHGYYVTFKFSVTRRPRILKFPSSSSIHIHNPNKNGWPRGLVRYSKRNPKLIKLIFFVLVESTSPSKGSLSPCEMTEDDFSNDGFGTMEDFDEDSNSNLSREESVEPSEKRKRGRPKKMHAEEDMVETEREMDHLLYCQTCATVT